MGIIDTVLKDRYRVLKYLGGGGFGFVYLAYDHDFRAEVAMKFPKEESLNQGIIEEAQKLFRLAKNASGEHIVKLDSLVVVGGKQTLVTEYCRGGSAALRTRPRTRKTWEPMAAAEVCEIIAQVCEGLEEAHKCRYIHRDIKPDNILLMEKQPAFGKAKLGDFGIAKILENSQGALTTIGTKAYMAPEVFDGRGAREFSDVYSLGVTMFRLLTGCYPIDIELPEYDFLEAKRNGVTAPIASFPSVDSRLHRLVSKAMAPDPADRYQTAREMRVEVTDVLVDLLVDRVLNRLQSPSTAETAFRTVETELRLLCQRFPTHRRSYMELAQLYRRRGWMQKSVEVLEAAHVSMPGDTKTLYLLAQWCAEIKDFYLAVGYMQRALNSAEGQLTARERSVGPKLVQVWKKSAHA